MINLMPESAKKEIRAARINVTLARYISVICLAFLFLVLLLGGSYVLLTQTKMSAQLLINANDTKAAVYSSTKTQVDSLSSKLIDAKSFLDQEILYSKLLTNIGQQMPEGTVLDQITLDAKSFTGSPISLKAYAKNNDTAVILRQKFQTSKLFSNVNFQSVSDSSSGVPGYPVSVSLTLVISKVSAK